MGTELNKVEVSWRCGVGVVIGAGGCGGHSALARARDHDETLFPASVLGASAPGGSLRGNISAGGSIEDGHEASELGGRASFSQRSEGRGFYQLSYDVVSGAY